MCYCWQASKVEQLGGLFAPVKISDVEGYLSQTFASTIRLFETVTLAVTIISIVVAILITALFLKMMLAKDLRQIKIMKGLGFTSAHIQTQYISAAALSLLLGLILGTIAAGTLGELLVGALMSNMGPSGSGKSTLLYNISGMDRVDDGSIDFAGSNINSLSEKELANLRLTKMGFVFQQHQPKRRDDPAGYA